jgi:hypothetical protein
MRSSARPACVCTALKRCKIPACVWAFSSNAFYGPARLRFTHWDSLAAPARLCLDRFTPQSTCEGRIGFGAQRTQNLARELEGDFVRKRPTPVGILTGRMLFIETAHVACVR